MSNVASSFGVSSTALANLQATYLTTTNGTDTTSLFSALNASSGAQATSEALSTGKLTQQQHDVLITIGDNGKNGQVVNYNQDREPSIITTLRQNGWIQQVHRNYDGKSGSATYSLTPVGREIYKRVGGTGDGLTPTPLASLNSDQQTLLSSIGDTGKTGYLQPLQNSAEPPNIVQLEQLGLISKTGQTYNPTEAQIVATYKLTTAGTTAYNAISANNATSAGSQAAIDAAQTTADATLSSTLSTATSLLSSLGVDISA